MPGCGMKLGSVEGSHTAEREQTEDITGCLIHTHTHIQQRQRRGGRRRSLKAEEEETEKRRRRRRGRRGARAPAWPCTSPPTCLPTPRSRTSSRLTKTSERSIKVGARPLYSDDSHMMTDDMSVHACLLGDGVFSFFPVTAVGIIDSAQVQTCDCTLPCL